MDLAINMHNEDFIIQAIVTLALAGFFLFLNRYIIGKLYRQNGQMHLLFVQRFVRGFVMIICVLLLIAEYWGMSRLTRLVAGSVAVFSAIVGFAAQNVLKDFFAGLMISIYRPFEIGDRLLLDNVEKACVVEELSMRHTVLKTMDGIRYIIPNSELNSRVITNTSYRQSLRGSNIRVAVSYDTDIHKAIYIVRQAVRECPFTVPNQANKANDDLGGYGDVYFMSFDDSSLALETVIWTEPETDNFLACSEVRASILDRFRKEGIEIPYSYVNIIEKNEEDMGYSQDASFKVKKRNARIKTDPIEINNGQNDINRVFEKVDIFAAYHSFKPEQTNLIRHLSEELFGFTLDATGQSRGRFWLEGSRNKVKICFRVRTEMSNAKRQELLDLSSDGKNAAASGFAGMIRELILSRRLDDSNATVTYSGYSSMLRNTEQNLEKKILTSLADDIKVGIKGNYAEITVIKAF